jgi:hypothetical protein
MSTQRIHGVPSASTWSASSASPARQRASCAAARRARSAQLAMSSLRSAKSPSSVASRSSAAVSSSSAALKPSLSAATRWVILAGVSPSASRSLRVAGAMPAEASGSSATSRAPARAATSASRESSASCPDVSSSPKKSVAVSGSWCASSRTSVLHAGSSSASPFVAQHHIGEEEVMVDDDDVGLQRGLARLQHEAVAVERAFGAEAVVARRSDERPDRGVLRNVGELPAITGGGRAREGNDLRQVPRIVAREEPPVGFRPREMVMAHVVRPALEQRERDRCLQRVAHQRQVALEELVLQRLRAGGDDDLAAVQESGHEIRERLAGSRAGLGDQRGTTLDRVGDGVRHRQLLRTEAKAGKRAGEETALAEDRVELAIGSARAGIGGRDGECGVAQVALLVFGGGVAGLPFLPLSAVGGALSLLATITARTASRAR